MLGESDIPRNPRNPRKNPIVLKKEFKIPLGYLSRPKINIIRENKTIFETYGILRGLRGLRGRPQKVLSLIQCG